MSDPKIYTVGWVCAIATEYVAARAVLDETHEGPEFTSVHDNNDYTLGRVGKHNVVIAVLPHGEYGLSSAASVARDMLHSFPNVRIGLMVGIGGGAPSRKHDIRLGDVVVSSSKSGASVFQYDFGKAIQDQDFQETGLLDQPPSILRAAVNGIIAQYEEDGHDIDISINEIFKRKPRLRNKYRRPDPSTDRLYKAQIVHPQDDDESGCVLTCGHDKSVLVMRTERTEEQDNPAIHYGRIASANKLMKDALCRDEFAAKQEVLCFEMEAAGLMNHFPCLVVRGICDYADSHKNKEWQGYAAMVASVYAKDLLRRIPPNRIEAMTRISDAISGLEEKVDVIIHHQQTGIDNTVLDWISPVDYGTEQSDYLRRRQPGTGSWFLESTQFCEWLKTSNQTLFCPGIPGAGKTIIASIVIDRLTSNRAADVGIAYVYCNFRRHAEQNAHALLASLLKRLTQCLLSLPAVVKSLYDKHKMERTRPSLDEISSALQAVSRTYQRVFIIVDALDECQDSDLCRNKFLSELFKLQTQCEANLLFTSRPLEDISTSFSASLLLPIVATSQDIEEYLEGHLGELRSCVKSNLQLQSTIKTSIAKAVDGMFLLAQIFLQSLKEKVTENAVRSALNEIHNMKEASGGDEGKLLSFAYDEAIARIKRQEKGLRELAMKVLSWIACAKRPLTIIEFQHAIATRRGASTLDPGDLIPVEDAVSVCAGLVTVDRASRIIRLTHYTTQHYFNDRRQRLFPDIHTKITESCVTYLSFTAFEEGQCSVDSFRQRLQANPFYNYASRNWGIHALEATTRYKQLAIEFLEHEGKVSASCQALMPPYDSTLSSQRSPQEVSGLHLAAYFGSIELLSALIGRGIDPNVTDGNGRTALAWAAQRGHHMAVKQLLTTKGIEPDSRDELKSTNKYHKSDMITMDIILKSAPSDRCCATPLWYAARNGHESCVELLLAEHNVNPNLGESWCGTTPLWAAAGNGHERTVDLLLKEQGVNLNSQDDITQMTALSVASSFGREEVVKLLLGVDDVDPNLTDCFGLTPLCRAILMDHTAIVSILLADKSVDPNSRDREGWTPLITAVERGSIQAVEMLLAVDGGDINAKDHKNQYSALHWAAKAGKQAVVKLLLADKRVDVHCTTGSNETPLELAVAGGYGATAKLLLSTKKANLHITFSLIMATKEGRAADVKLLLETNALQMRGGCGAAIARNALFYAVADGHVMNGDHVMAVKFLLGVQNVNVNAKNKQGRTLLHYAAERGHAEAVTLLLSKGADAGVLDDEGWTALMLAEKYERKDVVDLLIGYGIDSKSIS